MYVTDQNQRLRAMWLYFSNGWCAEVDLFSFDDAPAAAPAPAGNDDFGAFQTTTTAAAAPAPANDEFADFGTLRSAAPSAGPDPFAAPAPAQPPAQAQQQQSFDAFGNMAAASGGMNTGVQNAPSNAMAGTPGMGGVNNAFANMSMGTQQQPQPTSASNAGAGDDEFGDFADAPRSSMVKSNPSDPMAKLVSLDHLSKNPSQDKSNTSDEFSAFSMNQLQSQQGMV